MRTEQADPLISVRDLRIEFAMGSGRSVKALDGVSFDVRPGETLGIIGESGSGKTTLGRALVSLVHPTAGSVMHEGRSLTTLGARDFRRMRRDYQIIFQDPHAALNPRRTILASVMEPMEILGEADRGTRVRVALDMMERVGLSPEMAERFPHQLSGGQKQRVNIARALTLQPKVIVCDEVVAALDVSIRGSVLNLFAELQQSHDLTYVFITHDISVVSHISDRIGVAYLGKLVELGPAEDVIERPVHPYTKALLSAEPMPLPSSRRSSQRIRLQGEVPSPISPPSGCRFRTRCPAARPECAETVPVWREIRSGHWGACHFATAAGPPAFPNSDH